MRKIKNIDEVLSKHLLFLNKNPDGVRADLTRADLTGANLTDANIKNAKGIKW